MKRSRTKAERAADRRASTARTNARALRLMVDDRDRRIADLERAVAGLEEAGREREAEAGRLRSAATLAEGQRDEARAEARAAKTGANREEQVAGLEALAEVASMLIDDGTVVPSVPEGEAAPPLRDLARAGVRRALDDLNRARNVAGELREEGRRLQLEVAWLRGQLRRIACEDKYGERGPFGGLPVRNRQRALLGFVTERCFARKDGELRERDLEDVLPLASTDLRYLWDELGCVPPHLRERAEATLCLLSALFATGARGSTEALRAMVGAPSEGKPKDS